MELVPLDSKWDGLIDRSWIAELDNTSFLRRCRRGETTLAELHGFVRQQYYYSRHFTQYLCALLSCLDDEQDRNGLTQNLFEEMGLGDLGAVPHSQIYREMMKTMGVTTKGEPVARSTQALIEGMMTACRHRNPMVGLGALCLAAEAIVPHVYSQIVSGFLAAGESEANLIFFKIHIEGDDEHAVTMREIIDRRLAANPGDRVLLRATAKRLIGMRASFFDGLAAKPVEFARKVVYERV